jgi:hypothetical protein
MKHLLYTLLVLVSLSSCSNNDPTPAPALTGESWTLQSSITVATPKGKAPETPVDFPITEKVTMTFHSATSFSMRVTQTNGSASVIDSDYTYQGQTLKFPAIISWPTPFVRPQTLQVTELSAHKLVTERRWENIDSGYGSYEPTNYVTTQTFTR